MWCVFLLIFAADFKLMGVNKPQKMKPTAKMEVGLFTPLESPNLKYKIMQEDLRQVADLITANIIGTQKEVLTSDEAAKYLGVSKSCLYKWTMSRQIPHYKSPTGKMCFFNRKEIEAWMQSNRVQTDDELEQQAQTIIRKGGQK